MAFHNPRSIEGNLEMKKIPAATTPYSVGRKTLNADDPRNDKFKNRNGTEKQGICLMPTKQLDEYILT
jgi:hypothetical protein